MQAHLLSFIEDTGFQLCQPRQFKIKTRRLPLEVQSRSSKAGLMAFEACLFRYLALLPELTCSAPLFSSDFETVILHPSILKAIVPPSEKEDLPISFFVALGWVFHREGFVALHEWFSDEITPLAMESAKYYKKIYGEDLVFTEPLDISVNLRNVEDSLSKIPSLLPDFEETSGLSSSLSLVEFDEALSRNTTRRVNSCSNVRGWYAKTTPRRSPGIPRRKASIEFRARGRSETRFGPRPPTKSSDNVYQIRRILPVRLQSYQKGDWRRFALYNAMFMTMKPPSKADGLGEVL